ncbi:Mitochondrial outer membrane protein [Drechmeria coniospora]|uniref:Mitochondrial outer membrane protein n=1 Tax=Drechmeria coniospora TaxID=98403 RepID=A0A151GX81_DRECN|nr:Mitochondrial outer membrane protein [Drechmeria coniospora]KYK61708.1 Mitochondrial outer membrane protein [Drechmeria coniospora]
MLRRKVLQSAIGPSARASRRFRLQLEGTFTQSPNDKSCTAWKAGWKTVAMASEVSPNHLAESGITMHSDSEQYSPGEDLSTSPPSSSSPVLLYKPPTIFSLLRGAAINLLLPFINGMMLGFGELFAHEAAFRLGWGGTKVFPTSRRRTHPIGPGIEVRERREKPTVSLYDYASLE